MKEATRKAYGKELAALAVKDSRVVALTADLDGSNLTSYTREVRPEQHIDCGIAEQNMISMSAGLALSGMIPFASSFAMFEAGRAYEQIRNSIGYPHLNVKLCATHAGISVGEDGATHQPINDAALMRGIPGMVVLQPCDSEETKQIIDWAYSYEGPVYVRLCRLAVEQVHDESYKFSFDHADVLAEGKDTALLTSGLEVQECLKAREILKEHGIDAAVINLPVLKPLDTATVLEAAKKYPVVYAVEEHNIIGGLGSACAEVMAEAGEGRLVRIGIEDRFGQSGKPDELMEAYGISAAKIAERVLAGK